MDTSHDTDIFSYITRQENAYKQPVKRGNKTWSMKNHVERSQLYRDSDIVGEKTQFTPIKNITRPILNLQHRTEDIDVKDVELYVDDPEDFHLSFLVKKYHDDVFVQMYDLDTFFDQLNESRIDFGGALSKSLGTPCPEAVPLESIVFCDQRDILSRPIGLKHSYSPDELLDMADKGWGKESNGATASLEEVIVLARENPVDGVSEGDIEVYEVHGNLPKRFANQDDLSGRYETRLFIVCFYQKKQSTEKKGIILYTALETESPFKLIKRDPIFGRSLGFGGAEELFEAQVWVNYDMIRMQDMLDAAAKTIMITEDPTLAAKHPSGMKGMDNMEFLEEAPGGNTRQLDTFPRNIKIFEDSVTQWETHAQQMGAANDSIMGDSPTAGTPFKLQELVTQESHGLHDYRRGQYAKHIEEIYKDWIIPHIEKKICEGTTFLSELSLEELQFVTDHLTTKAMNTKIKQGMLEGKLMSPEEQDAFKTIYQDTLGKKGNQHFIEILKGEFKNKSLGVKVNVAGKQKNLAGMTDKITNIFRFAFSNPQGFAQTMQIPGMAKSFNEILEYSGLSPVDFSGIDKLAAQQPQDTAQPQPQTPQAKPSPIGADLPQLSNGK